jgi:hypothetical protein
MGGLTDPESLYGEMDHLDAMDREELTALLGRLQAYLAELDRREPADMGSEAYEDWGELHEEAEDAADEVQDRLDELA